MIDKPDTASFTFVAIQTSIVYCMENFNVANPPFSRTFEARLQRFFLYGLPNVGYYNSKANYRTPRNDQPRAARFFGFQSLAPRARVHLRKITHSKNLNSITLSARTMIEGGMVMPSALVGTDHQVHL